MSHVENTIFPVEIMNQIMSYYWSNMFYENVVSNLVSHKIKMYRIHRFLTIQIIPRAENIHLLTYLHHYLKEYNTFLKDIAHDTGLRLYLSIDYPKVKHITRFVTENAFRSVKEKYRYVCNYCCCLSNFARYHVIYGFQQILDS